MESNEWERQRARPQLQCSQQQGQIISEPPNAHLISEYMDAMQTDLS